jgi:UDP-N-acetylmuramoyl-L-alanyl-D-glutamate--2,6-diaminopimelate ligase
MGVRSGFFSTVAMQTADAVIPNGLRQSTPEALELHGVLADMVARGKTHAVIESTSHGLSRRTARLLDVPFRVAVFTNLSHEHLEFHGTYEQYRSDKANLFRDLVATPGQAAFAVVNAGDPEAGYFTAACRQPVLGYGSELCPPALAEGRAGRLQLFASEIAAGSDSSEFTLHYAPDGRILPWPAGSARVRLPLPGTFNIENIMAALLACAGVLSRSPLELLGALGGLVGIKGRMLPVNQGQPFSVIVDYAHTPGAYAKVLPMFRAGTTGRLIAVFGSAGERDQDKRPMQRELAARYCDELVLTNEDPRLEDELAIIDQIAAGALAQRPGMPVWRIPDRRAAIRHAIALAKPGDTVILLGKGHEQCIIFPDGKHPWDEETVARGILAESGWTGISGGAES